MHGYKPETRPRRLKTIHVLPTNISPPVLPVNTPQMKLALLNVRSLNNKTFLVNELIKENNLDCICLTETWLNDDTATATLIEACPPDYSFHQVSRKSKRGGGVAAIFSSKLLFKITELGEFTSIEYLAIELKTESVLFVIIYRPPKHSPIFIQEFSELLSLCVTRYDKIVLNGDLNIHVNKKADQRTIELLNLLTSFDLTQHITDPTHQHGNTLDLLITTGLNINNISITDLPLSDHHCILFDVEIILPKTTKEFLVHKRHLDDEATERFSEQIALYEPTNHDRSLDEMVENLNEALSSVLDTVAPLKTKNKFTSRTSPWLRNKNVSEIKRKCRVAERKWRKTKTTIHHGIYKDALTTYNKTIRLARKGYFSHIITENAGNSRVLFSTIDRLLNTVPAPPLSSAAKCEEFAQFFKNKITSIRSSITTGGEIDIRSCNLTMSSFTCITLSELSKIIIECKSTTSDIDPIPTAFFKRVFDSVSGPVLDIINTSLRTGVFPDAFKTAVVKPLLKKPKLDTSTLANYRPISNLPFISKVLEKIVLVQINSFLEQNNILEVFQSGFRKYHSTETALTKIISDLRQNSDANKVSILILLDLSAAFDTIDHDILINRLENLIGFSDCVLNWIKTYIRGRKFCVSLGDHMSEKHESCYGVAQGSCLGPLLFSFYVLPLSDIIREYSIDFHSYADDTQLYISAEPNDAKAINSITNCLLAINKWMNNNFLKLNEDKTEVLLIGPKLKREMLIKNLGGLTRWIKPEVISLGVILDSDLNFNSHINKVTKTAFFHLRNIAKVRPFINQNDAEKLTHAFISSRLDYCNSLFADLPKKTTERLQLIQNSAARLLTKTKRREHISPVLATLHWLPVTFRIDFKVLLLTYKALNGQGPSYIANSLTNYTPARTLRSSDTGLLQVTRSSHKKIGDAAFVNYAPKLWNTLPINIREAKTLDTFKKQLKTFLFTKAFY
jgi:hypothetical protein